VQKGFNKQFTMSHIPEGPKRKFWKDSKQVAEKKKLREKQFEKLRQEIE